MSGLLRRRRYADVVGSLALVVATSGAAYAVHALLTGRESLAGRWCCR